jgi:hypothetical protein
MPHTPTSLFADMLGLLKEIEGSSDVCPVCLRPFYDGKFGHNAGCRLHATIALAEEQVRIVGVDTYGDD